MLMFDVAGFFFVYNICKFRGIVTQMKKKICLFQQVIEGHLKSEDPFPVRSAMFYCYLFCYYLLQRYVEWLILRIRRH